jgi:hypothetical protein
MTIQRDFESVDEFFAAINKERKINPQQWIFFAGLVNGLQVKLKTYGASYLQVYTVNDSAQRLSSMDCKISEWKNAILAPFTR